MPSFQEKRRYRRFKLQYPVHVLFRSQDLIATVDALSRDVSAGGLLLEAPTLIPPHSAVSFVISLHGPMLPAVELTGEGEVVRVEPGAAVDRFVIAVECKNPITQIQPYLPSELS
jgi:hypothetical protein